MEYHRLFDALRCKEHQYIEFWKDVCNIESPTGYKEGVDRCARLFERKALELGFQCDWHREQKSGDVLCITMNPEAKDKPVALSGHLDTVHPVGLFGTPAVRIEGDKMVGPGVMDCKGGAVASLMTMDALAEIGFVKRPVMLLLQSDEENGSRFSDKRTIGYICEKAKNATAFLNMEGHKAGRVCIGRKGIVSYHFEVTGVEAHSSNCATAGASAICQAAHMILELEKFKDDGGLTCNCGVIEGGSVPNTVPGKCTFIANVRFANGEQLAQMESFVEKLANTIFVDGCSCRLTRYSFRQAMEPNDRNLGLLARVNEILTANGLDTLEGKVRNGGSDAADTTAFGIPTLDSLGVEGGKVHSPQEFAVISSLLDCAKRTATIIYGI